MNGRHYSNARPEPAVWESLCKLLILMIPLSLLGLLLFVFLLFTFSL